MSKPIDGVDVVVHTAKGQVAGWVRGVSSSWIRDRKVGAWGEVAFLDQLRTAGGDSGCPVTLQGSPDQLVGHVVAGAASHTIVQDAGYQLGRHAVTLRTP